MKGETGEGLQGCSGDCEGGKAASRVKSGKRKVFEGGASDNLTEERRNLQRSKLQSLRRVIYMGDSVKNTKG